MKTLARDVQPYLDAIESGDAGRVGADGWVGALRRAAAARFGELGFPTRRLEAWRYLDLRGFQQEHFHEGPKQPPRGPDPAAAALVPGEAAPVVLFNGNPLAVPGAGEGIEVRSLEEWLRENPEPLRPLLARVANDATNPFLALNTAFLERGLHVRIPAGVEAARPLHLLFVTGGGSAAAHSRVLVELEAGARATVVEEYVSLGEGATFTDPVTEISLGDGARLDHVRLQREGERAFHVATLAARLGREASFASTSLVLGGGLTRVDLRVDLAGEGATSDLRGLYLVDGERVVDHHTATDHRVPRTSSRQVYKGVLDGRSRAVFNGLVEIHPGARQTQAAQSNPNLLLSERALVHTNPQLRIFNDDVQCNHGATVGRLDREKLFYLRARGIPAAEARQILIGAFAKEIVETVPVEALREALGSTVEERLTDHV